MFGSYTTTQTATQTATQGRTGVSLSRYTTHNDTTNNNIIFAIVTGNLQEVRTLVNASNVNNIIDIKNKYTALHYAVKLPNNEIVEYLMSIGANPNTKQNEGKDAIDLSIESNKRYLVDRLIKSNSRDVEVLTSTCDDLKSRLRTVEKNNTDLKATNDYLLKSNGEYVTRIDKLNAVIEEKNTENQKLKRKLDESETAFTNLLKKNKK
jgi:ankyrin repeat protein